MLDEVEREILRHVTTRDGNWYWYQLAREIKPENAHQMMPAIRRLEGRGLLEVRPNPSMDEHDRYWITDAGRQELSPPKS